MKMRINITNIVQLAVILLLAATLQSQEIIHKSPVEIHSELTQLELSDSSNGKSDTVRVDDETDSVSTDTTKTDVKTVFRVNPDKCIGCGLCMFSCPEDAIEFKDGKAIIDPKKCKSCGTCVKRCPTGAIEQYKVEQDKQEDEKTDHSDSE